MVTSELLCPWVCRLSTLDIVRRMRMAVVSEPCGGDQASVSEKLNFRCPDLRPDCPAAAPQARLCGSSQGALGGCGADWFQGWRDGNLQESGKIALCQGLIQSSGIKPLARGLSWNFTSTDLTHTRLWLSRVPVWLSQRFP